ncbi:MAG TPA: PIG-L family deacetylase [Polyangiaceae bacterium]|nr:PIG-L family deacetylase [Polyangiaceae bacterium]
MKLQAQGAEIFIPDGSSVEVALARTTHLGLCAHQDDLEIMAYHGIIECFQRTDRWFSGVTLTSGAGSARDLDYKNYSDAQMIDVRKLEQKKAAYVGEYSAMVLLNHPSAAVKDPRHAALAADLDAVLAATKPEVVYTHNLADKHDTHVAVALRVVGALRRLPKELRPKRVIGCEVWRDLDWLCDADKVVMPVDRHDNLADALTGVFDSQICGGKRYDLAASGRRLANATFFESHQVDKSSALAWGIDMTPLVEDDARDPLAFVEEHIARFQAEVSARIAKMR